MMQTMDEYVDERGAEKGRGVEDRVAGGRAEKREL